MSHRLHTGLLKSRSTTGFLLSDDRVPSPNNYVGRRHVLPIPLAPQLPALQPPPASTRALPAPPDAMNKRKENTCPHKPSCKPKSTGPTRNTPPAPKPRRAKKNPP